MHLGKHATLGSRNHHQTPTRCGGPICPLGIGGTWRTGGADIGSVTVAATTDGHRRAVQWAAQFDERHLSGSSEPQTHRRAVASYGAVMSYESNKVLARVWFDEVMNRRDPTAIARTYGEDYRHSGPAGLHVRGRTEATRVAEMLYTAMPDRVSTVERQVAEGDLVVTQWSSRGTNTGPLMGRPPTNEPVVVHGITISRIADGLIAEDWEITQVLDGTGDPG